MERKKATGMNDQEFFFEERFQPTNEGRDSGGKLTAGLKNGALQKDFSPSTMGDSICRCGIMSIPSKVYSICIYHISIYRLCIYIYIDILIYIYILI